MVFAVPLPDMLKGFRSMRHSILHSKVVHRCCVTFAALLLCSPTYAVSLTCEIESIGPRRTYTMTVEDNAKFVTGTSGDKSRQLPIVGRIETDEMRALMLNNGDDGVKATLVLWPQPRLELVLRGGFVQIDPCWAS